MERSLDRRMLAGMCASLATVVGVLAAVLAGNGLVAVVIAVVLAAGLLFTVGLMLPRASVGRGRAR